MQKLLNIWWTLYPSVNINIYYLMMDFVHEQTPQIQQHFLKTAYEQCTPREQQFLKEKGLYTNKGKENE